MKAEEVMENMAKKLFAKYGFETHAHCAFPAMGEEEFYEALTEATQSQQQEIEGLKQRLESKTNLCLEFETELFRIREGVGNMSAEWIAERLKLAADLEELTYNYATGKIEGKDIVDYVQKALDKI
jgi:hypothetical protein